MVAVLVSFSMSSCSDDDEGISGDAEELIVGTWHSTRYSGYETIDGEKDITYDDVYEDEEYIFNADGTGRWRDLTDNDKYSFDWVISGKKLILDEGTYEEEVYTIVKLNSKELQIEYYEKYNDDECCDKVTFKRIN